MKKFLALLLCAATLMLTFTSCMKKVGEEGDVTVIVETANGEYEVYKTYLENVENKSNGVLGVLENLAAREENPLHIVYSESAYGAYITEIGSIKEDSASAAYVMVYTSIAADSYEGAATVTYEETLLYSSGVGVSMLSANAGTIILFRLEVYSF